MLLKLNVHSVKLFRVILPFAVSTTALLRGTVQQRVFEGLFSRQPRPDVIPEDERKGGDGDVKHSSL